MGKDHRYRIVVEWSDEDKCFIARVPAFDACVAHGDTESEAAKQARIAMNATIKVMRKHGDPLPESDVSVDYSGKFNVRLPKWLHRQLAIHAEIEGVSLNQHVVSLLAARDTAESYKRR